MAVVSRIATLEVTALGSSRTFVATATTQDTAAGGSVDITLTTSTSGATPPAAPELKRLRFYNDSGGLIREINLDAAAWSGTQTFHFTSTGSAGAAARCGTVEIAIYVNHNTGIGQYEIETDGSPNVGGMSGVLDRGWIRGTTTLTESISNVALGGAKTEPAAYDESLYVRCVNGADSYESRALTVALSAGSVSGSTNTTTSATRDVTFANVVDDRFAAAVTSVGVIATAPNATLTGQPAWTYTTTTDDSINVDPRLTHTMHFQVDDTTFGTGKHAASKQMLATQSGFIWDKVTNARGTGVDGITLSQTLTPTLPGTAVGPVSGMTSTQDGLAGVSGRLDWTASKPGGAWTWTIDVTAPADIDADTHELGGSDTVTMLAPNPNYRVILGVAPTFANDDDHWRPGDDLEVAAALVDVGALDLLTLGATTPNVIVARFTAAGKIEYLEDDLDTWTTLPIDGSGAANSIDMVAASTVVVGGDTRIYVLIIPGANTSDWGSVDIVAIANFTDSAGTPYSSSYFMPVVAANNLHGGYALDALGLALHGIVSQR